MALSKADLIDGLRTGLSVRSQYDQKVYPLHEYVASLDLRVIQSGEKLDDLARRITTGDAYTIGEFVMSLDKRVVDLTTEMAELRRDVAAIAEIVKNNTKDG